MLAVPGRFWFLAGFMHPISVVASGSLHVQLASAREAAGKGFRNGALIDMSMKAALKRNEINEQV